MSITGMRVEDNIRIVAVYLGLEIFLFSQSVLWVSLGEKTYISCPREKDRVFPRGLKIPNKLRKFFAELPYPFPQNEGNCRGKKIF